MKLEILKEIIKKKENKSEFAIVTKISTGESEIFIDKEIFVDAQVTKILLLQ